MTTLIVRGPANVSGTAVVPGDKSISHRAVMIGAAAAGRTTVRNVGPGEDVASTISCLMQYGVAIEHTADVVTIDSRGIDRWDEPGAVLDCGNSGTTMRVLAGLAARCAFPSVLDGDESLRRRPMERVAGPLRALGADVKTSPNGCAPLAVYGGALRGAAVDTGIASAQVKSSLLLAALGAEGRTTVTEPFRSRDHTERMLAALGAEILENTNGVHRIEVGAFATPPFDVGVPGDVSSAAFLVALAVLAGSLEIDGVGLNPSRIGFLHAVRAMGGAVSWDVDEERMNEPVGTIVAERSTLRGTTVGEAVMPSLHDEIPLIGVLATQAEGETVVSGADELRIKESDRIAVLVEGLRRLGADIEERPDGFIVRGPTVLQGAKVSSAGDHRIAMCFAVAGAIAKGETRIEGFDCAAVSWPGFEHVLESVGVELELS